MALNPDIRDQAYQFFLEEAPELLQVIETGLLTLNSEWSTAKIHSLMRAAHSLKGGASSVGLDAIATLAHRLENIFKVLYNSSLAVDPELESWLLQAYDCLRLPFMEHLSTGSFDAVQALATAEPIFSQIEAQYGDALAQADSYIPSSTEMGVDMVASIFEMDVAQSLEELAAIVAHAQDYDLAAELQNRMEVFTGFAELLNLPNFGAIAQVVQQALMLHPDRALEIAQLALIEFESSKQAVLAGDRLGGTGPSVILIEFTAGNPIRTEDSAGRSLEVGQGAIEPSDQLIEIAAETETNIAADSVQSLAEIEFELPLLASILDDIAPALEAALGGVVETVNSVNPVETGGSIDHPLESLEITESINLFDTPDLTSNLSEPSLNSVDFQDLNLSPDAETEVRVAEEIGVGEIEFKSIEPEYIQRDIETEYLSAQNLTQQDETANFVNLPLEQQPEQKEIESLIPIDPSLERSLQLSDAGEQPAIQTPQTSEQTLLNWQPTVSQVARSVPNLTVRVDSDRLERMNNVVGELSINRSSLALQNDQLQRVLKELRSRFARFQTMVSQLQKTFDRMLIAPDQVRAEINLSGGLEPEYATRIVQNPVIRGFRTLSSDIRAIEFDALEMDRYGVSYSQLQAILEDLVQLEESVDDIALFTRQSTQTLDHHQAMLTQLRNELVWARMLPLSEILNRFPRLLRDLSVTYQKPINLKLTGAEVLIDRAILEKLYDPLLHLLRNAFDHGIEPVHLRQQRGKPEQGQIEIRAFYKGNQTIIEVRDDGQGINLDRICQRALDLNWFSAEQLATLPPSQLLELIFEPGFSTASQVSELSGRGFGLDVVRSQLQAIKGTIALSSLPEQGTTFTLSLPLTLTITQLLVCLAGTLPLALPVDGIVDILTPRSDQIQQSESEQKLRWRDQWIPIHPLSQLLHYACPVPSASASRTLAAFPAPKDWAAPLIVIRQEQQVFGVVVDRILTEQELVIKPFGSAVAPPKYMYGCTILGDGSPIPVIDAVALRAMVFNPAVNGFTPAGEPGLMSSNQSIYSGLSELQTIQAPTILVVDDAVTLRRTLALFLEREGFRVLQAQDGREAIDRIQQNSSVQLVVCDIEMPNMNGFEFLNYRRQTSKLAAIPIVMLTSRSNEKHRWLAMQLGATAYFTKPYLEQELLATLKTLLASV